MKSKIYNLMKCAFLLTAILIGGSAMAQKRVTGKVLGSDNSPIPGANVTIKGTTVGTITDADGVFAIDTRSDNDVLVFASIGYKSQQITVGTQTSITMTLAEDISALDEVVVTGYTTDSKRESTAAVSTVKAQDLKAVPSGNVEQQLQGRVSGVTIITNGQPGTSSIVRVRGFGAFGGNEPLYIIDGVPTTSTDFLAPDDIESTTVLKDAAAASIYGARAANGVIVYTTKKGAKKARKLEVNYDALYGVTTPGTGTKMLNPQDMADWTWNAIRNTATSEGRTPDFSSTYNPSASQYGTGTSPVLPDYLMVGPNRRGVVGTIDVEAERAKYQPDPLSATPLYLVMPSNKSGTDWYKAITRNAPLTRHNLGFSGGTETSRFYFSLGFQDQKGIVLNNQLKRYEFRANTEFDLGKKVRFGENLQFTYRSVNGQSGPGNGAGIAQDESIVLTTMRMPTIIPVHDLFGGWGGTAAGSFSNGRNPVQNLYNNSKDTGFGIGGFGNVYAEYDVIPNLTFKTSFGGNVGMSTYRDYTFVDEGNSEPEAGKNSLREGSQYGYTWVWTNTANFKRKFGVHAIDALVGIESLTLGAGRNIEGFGQDPFSTDINYLNLSTLSSGKTISGGNSKGVNFFSVFGQVKYNYNDKYFLTAVLRRDGSSRFGANNRYGVFPAFSAAWRVSSEEFMKDLTFITDLKLRAGWGTMGNSNNVNPDNQYNLYGSSVGNAFYPISGSNTTATEGFYRSRIGNKNAKWETAETSNIGLDATLLNGRFEIQIDFWKKNTKDLLFNVPLAGVVGTLANAPAVNIANMVNKGIDLQLINRGNIISNGDLKYEATVNGSFLNNKITYLAPGIDYFDTSPPTNRLSTIPSRNALGYSLASFYGYQVQGYFKDQAEVDGAATQAGAAPGRFRYADLNGDGQITADDRKIIGSPVPKFTGGVYLKVSYKNFDVISYLYTSLGGKIFNLSKWYTSFYSTFPGSAKAESVKSSWSTTNLNPNGPIFENVSNFSTDTQANSWYVENGSYLRMQNLSVAYNLPTDLLSKIGFRKARITLSTNNVFTISGYSGLDPAVGGAVDTNFGVDIGNYPVTRSYNVGVNLGF